MNAISRIFFLAMFAASAVVQLGAREIKIALEGIDEKRADDLLEKLNGAGAQFGLYYSTSSEQPEFRILMGSKGWNVGLINPNPEAVAAVLTQQCGLIFAVDRNANILNGFSANRALSAEINKRLANYFSVLEKPAGNLQNVDEDQREGMSSVSKPPPDFRNIQVLLDGKKDDRLALLDKLNDNAKRYKMYFSSATESYEYRVAIESENRGPLLGYGVSVAILTPDCKLVSVLGRRGRTTRAGAFNALSKEFTKQFRDFLENRKAR